MLTNDSDSVVKKDSGKHDPRNKDKEELKGLLVIFEVLS